MDTFPERLKQLRKERKVTQVQLSTAIGITDRACQKHEAGENEPSMSALIAIADYFDVSIDYLVGRSDRPKRQ